jgi:methionyl-tRNA formyltransferase
MRTWNKYRAYDPWPGIYTFFQGKMLKLIDIAYCPSLNPDLPPGTVFQHTFPQIEATFLVIEKVVPATTMVMVKTSDGSIGLDKVQVEGKKPMLIKDFLNGYRSFVGSVLPSPVSSRAQSVIPTKSALGGRMEGSRIFFSSDC